MNSETWTDGFGAVLMLFFVIQVGILCSYLDGNTKEFAAVLAPTWIFDFLTFLFVGIILKNTKPLTKVLYWFAIGGGIVVSFNSYHYCLLFLQNFHFLFVICLFDYLFDSTKTKNKKKKQNSSKFYLFSKCINFQFLHLL